MFPPMLSRECRHDRYNIHHVPCRIAKFICRIATKILRRIEGGVLSFSDEFRYAEPQATIEIFEKQRMVARRVLRTRMSLEYSSHVSIIPTEELEIHPGPKDPACIVNSDPHAASLLRMLKAERFCAIV